MRVNTMATPKKKTSTKPTPKKKKTVRDILKKSSIKSERVVMQEIEKQMKTEWPWASVRDKVFFNKDEQIAPIAPGVLPAKNNALDKLDAFEAMLSEPYMFFLNWQSVEFRHNLVGLQTDQISFRKYFATKDKWAKFLESMLELDKVLVSNLGDTPDQTVFSIACFDPLLIQSIDELIKGLVECETKEYLERIKEIKPMSQDNPAALGPFFSMV